MSLLLEDREERSPDGSHRGVRLSRREVEVLRLVAIGLESKEAAEALFLSKRTVDFHLSNVYEKLGVRNRLSAVRKAERSGLLPFEPYLL